MAGVRAEDYVPANRLIAVVERRKALLRTRSNAGYRQVLAPHLTHQEWTRSTLRRKWYRVRNCSTVTVYALDDFARALGVHPSELED